MILGHTAGVAAAHAVQNSQAVQDIDVPRLQQRLREQKQVLSMADAVKADIWQKSLSDEIELWIELGQPDEKRIRQACGRSRDVYIYTYSGHSAEIWWEQIATKVSSINNLHIYNLPANQRNELSQLSHKNMNLQTTIQDGEIWLSDGEQSATINLECWKE